MVFCGGEIKCILQEEKVSFLNLQFTDIFGKTKNVTIPVEQLDRALRGEIMFDGSSVEGFVRVEESDMFLVPDLSTFALLPREICGKQRMARFICDVYRSNGKPFEGCPRGILKRAMESSSEMGYELRVGPEVEFFLFETDGKGNPVLHTHDNAGYFDLAPDDRGEETRQEICVALQSMGFTIEASHHECAPGQHEVIFEYDNALKTADNITTFKLVVKNIAKKNGLHATFMPKPISGRNGNCMHLHMSLFKEDKNAFYNEFGELGLSEETYYFMGGLLKYAREYSAITNPTVNSYKRLISGFEAPTHIVWADGSRSPLIRVPKARGERTRIELRNPDATSNHYIVFSVILSAGLRGITEKIFPPKKHEGSYLKEGEANGIARLPINLGEALECMRESSYLNSIVGDHFYSVYLKAKEREWKEYRESVHRWEIEKYLRE